MTAVIDERRQMSASPMLLSLRLTRAERQAIGYHLTGKPVEVGNRVASRFLHDELRRTLKGVIVEYEMDHEDELFLVGKGNSDVWHIAQGDPVRDEGGWKCAVVCDSRQGTYDRATMSLEDAEARLCRNCVKSNTGLAKGDDPQ